MIGSIIGAILGSVITGIAVRRYMHWSRCTDAHREAVIAHHDSTALRKAALAWEQSHGLPIASLEGSITKLAQTQETMQAEYDKLLTTPFVERLLFDWRDSGMAGLLRSSLVQNRQVAIAIVQDIIERSHKSHNARSA
ncbi:MAG: hypothetical protein Q8R16_02255 [bacterium]|nr:hypothetical protein [bacterium]